MQKKQVKSLDWRVVVSALLLAFGLFRSADFILQSPAYGYGNSYDMVRVQACFDWWPNIETRPSGAHTSRPANYYMHYALPSQSCYISSGLGFFWLAQFLADKSSIDFHDAKKEHEISLQWFGIVHVLALWAAVFGVHLLFRPWASARLANAAFFALVLADPLNQLYANTLYLEYSALIFATLAVGALFAAIYKEKASRRLCAILLVALTLFATVKMQYQFTPFVAAIVYLLSRMALHYRSEKKVIFACFGAGLIAFCFIPAYQILVPSAQYFYERLNMTNKTNAVLGTLLGNASDVSLTLKQLGLPPSCAPHAGKTWFTKSVQHHHPCPEVGRVSRIRALKALLLDPAMMLKIMKAEVHQTQDWITPRFGTRQDADFYRLQSHRFGREFSLASGIKSLPQGAYALLIVAALPFTGFLALAIIAFTRLRGQKVAYKLLPLFLCVSLFASMIYLASLLGDGALGAVKQCHLAYSLLLLWLGDCIYWLFRAYFRK